MSQEEYIALSPELGSKSFRKALKKKKGSRKKGSNKVAQKLEHLMISQDTSYNFDNNISPEFNNKMYTSELGSGDFQEEISNHENTISNESMDNLNTNNCSVVKVPKSVSSASSESDFPETILERIEALEKLEMEKSNIVKALSIDKVVLVEKSHLNLFEETLKHKTNENIFSKIPKQNEEVPDFGNNLNENKTFLDQSLKISERANFIGFQTGTGKTVEISEKNVEKFSKLFDDILTNNAQGSRTNKFNYLKNNKLLPEVKGQFFLKNNDRNSFQKIESTSINSPLKGTENLENPSENIEMLLGLKNNSRMLPIQQRKNIFEGENFDDIQNNTYKGFQTALTTLKVLNPLKQDETEVNFQRIKNASKGKFEGKSSGYLGLQRNKAIESLERKESVSFSTFETQTKSKVRKNIFEGEDFSDLFLQRTTEKDSFKKPSEHLNVYKAETKCKETKSIFVGEDFSDIALDIALNTDSKFIGFQKATTAFPLSSESKENTGPYVKNTNVSMKLQELQGTTDSLLPKGICSRTIPSSSKISTKTSFKKIFEGENFDDLKLADIPGFQTASRNIQLSKSLEKNGLKSVNNFNLHSDQPNQKKSSFGSGKRPFKNIFEGENFDDLNLVGIPDFHNKLSSNMEAQKFSGKFNSSIDCSRSQSLSSNVSKGLLVEKRQFKNIFEGENFDDLNLKGLGPKFQGFVSSTKSTLFEKPRANTFESPYIPNMKKIENINIEEGADQCVGFTDAEKEAAVNLSDDQNDAVTIIENRFKDFSKNSYSSFINLTSIEELSKKVQTTIHKIESESNLTKYLGKKRRFSELESDHNFISKNSSGKNTTPFRNQNSSLNNNKTPFQINSVKRPKRKLGCHFSPTLQVSDSGLKRAKLMFEDLEPRNVQTSTPIRFEGKLAQPLACDITPIQSVKRNLGNTFANEVRSTSFHKSVSTSFNQTLVNTALKGRLSLNKPSSTNVNVWIESLNQERRLLEERLRVLDEKQTILVNQKTILEFSKSCSKSITSGILYTSKEKNAQIPLKDFIGDIFSVDEKNESNILDQINPQNAHLVHFYSDLRSSHIQTSDGAIVVPNVDGRLGISEIEHSFIIMDGVDQRLIPPGWIKNHFKWIVWKLASYERIGIDKFEGCLSVENVVQQLKYRYDLEIDKVKRSCLRKILEKDDTSQRRMVLCVSQIMKVGDTYELELTDGWYSIRTVIDPPLQNQIVRGKIRIGVKLLIYGAELMNCDGCHPLEATDLIYLKINYNCTRRAIWWAKLGYQRDSSPFVIPFSSINLEGGKIGCIKCCIVRVYPVKYMEKLGEKSIWRNKKAEERREQAYQNEKLSLIEQGYQCVDKKRNSFSNVGFNELIKMLRNTEDPEVLYDILQKSGDPESIQENLTSYQKTILSNYAINKSAEEYSSMLSKMQETSRTLQDRSVTALFKIKIVDATVDSTDKIYDFHIWRPHENHLYELREGELVTIYNVSCSSSWGLSANRSTQFKTESKSNNSKYEKFRRKLVPIHELKPSCNIMLLNEFDTVGIVIFKKVCDFQEVWISDCNENLLLVKIYDMPKNILLLDVVEEGQIISACNLFFKQSLQEYTFATADHFTVFSRYPRQRHLEEGIELFQNELKTKDIQAILQNCRYKVNRIQAVYETKKTKSIDIDDIDSSQITSEDLALLECMEKLA